MWRTQPLILSSMALFLVLTLFCSCVFYLNCTISQNCILYNYITECAHLGRSFCVWASISYNNCMIYNLPIGFIPHMYTYYSDQTLCMNCCNLVGTLVAWLKIKHWYSIGAIANCLHLMHMHITKKYLHGDRLPNRAMWVWPTSRKMGISLSWYIYR